MNHFDSEQLAPIRGREIQHADKLVPSRFWVQCRVLGHDCESCCCSSTYAFS